MTMFVINIQGFYGLISAGFNSIEEAEDYTNKIIKKYKLYDNKDLTCEYEIYEQVKDTEVRIIEKGYYVSTSFHPLMKLKNMLRKS